MQKPYMKIKRLHPEAKIPAKRAEDAGFDLYAAQDNEFIILRPGDIHLMPTGISFEIPKDWVFYIVERSSTGTKGIAQRCGVIDSGYRGEIKAPLSNASNKTIVFYKDESKIDSFLRQENLAKEEVTLYPLSKAIAQGMLLYAPHVEVEEVQNHSQLSDSERQDTGWGASGK